ncbi:MAG: hypothetical protein MHM6MM_005379 [Cercozoa sp. M6MM]
MVRRGKKKGVDQAQQAEKQRQAAIAQFEDPSNPYLIFVNKKLRNLKKRQSKLVEYETQSFASLNPSQKEALASLPQVRAQVALLLEVQHALKTAAYDLQQQQAGDEDDDSSNAVTDIYTEEDEGITIEDPSDAPSVEEPTTPPVPDGTDITDLIFQSEDDLIRNIYGDTSVVPEPQQQPEASNVEVTELSDSSLSVDPVVDDAEVHSAEDVVVEESEESAPPKPSYKNVAASSTRKGEVKNNPGPIGSGTGRNRGERPRGRGGYRRRRGVSRTTAD